MRRRPTLRTTLLILACTSAVPLALISLTGCKKPPPAVVDAGAPPEAPDTSVAALVPLDEDAGEADASDAAPAHPAAHGAGLNTNQSRAKQCCNALRAQAKQLGASPEANMLIGFATTCDTLALQVGPTAGGQAPELAPLRAMLKGHTLPAVCQGL
jgi:hypothetical protein